MSLTGRRVGQCSPAARQPIELPQVTRPEVAIALPRPAGSQKHKRSPTGCALSARSGVACREGDSVRISLPERDLPLYRERVRDDQQPANGPSQ